MDEYKILSEKEAIDFAKANAGVFGTGAEIKLHEIGDGNINFVYRLTEEASGKSAIFKQALPYVRIVGDKWPLTIDRSRIETESLRLYNELCPGCAPEVYFSSDEMAVGIVEDLSGLKILRNELMNMRRFPKFAGQMGSFLSKIIFYTSDLYMDPSEKKALVKKFSNPEMCKIVEDLVFTDPYFDAASNSINPELMRDVKEFWKDGALRMEVTRLKTMYMTRAQCLIHGDLHTGSVFIGEDRMKVFDTEFAFFGPAGYDIGLVIANLYLNYASWEGRDDTAASEKEEYQAYILQMAEELMGGFELAFSENWEKDARAEFKDVKGYKEQYLKELFEDAIGMGGCEVMRRVVGLAHVPDLDSIADLKQRARAQRLAWKIGSMMVKKRQTVQSFPELTENIRAIKSKG